MAVFPSVDTVTDVVAMMYFTPKGKTFRPTLTTDHLISYSMITSYFLFCRRVQGFVTNKPLSFTG